jgi:L-malate glycosyltransferase
VRAAAAGLPVEFAGWVGDIGAALSALDLVLVPSAPYEATPRVIMEAFAAGVPVMAYPSGGIPELIENERTGFLARTAAEMAARAIELLGQGRDRLAAVSGAAGTVGRTRFSLDRFHREVLDAMQAAAG